MLCCCAAATRSIPATWPARSRTWRKLPISTAIPRACALSCRPTCKADACPKRGPWQPNCAPSTTTPAPSPVTPTRLWPAGHYAEVLQVYQQYSDRLVATDSGKVLESLHALIGHMRENVPALEILLDLSQKAGDTTHITELYELLGACLRAVRKSREGSRLLSEAHPTGAAEPAAHSKLSAGSGQAGRRCIRLATHHARRRRGPGGRTRSHRTVYRPALSRRSCPGSAGRADRRRTFRFLQHAGQGAGPFDVRSAQGSPRSAHSTSAWPRCTPGPAASAKPRFAAAIWNSFITMPDIPTKPAAIAIWPASTKNALPPSRSQGEPWPRPAIAVCASTRLLRPRFDHLADPRKLPTLRSDPLNLQLPGLFFHKARPRRCRAPANLKSARKRRRRE